MKTRRSLWRMTLLLIVMLVAQHTAMLAKAYGELTVQAGWFTAHQGKKQHVDIEGLIGDEFSVDKSSDQNIFAGVGYYFDGLKFACTNTLYGINAFYFAPTKVHGKVTQEDLFTNLAYRYSRRNYPIYFATKTLIPWGCFSDFTVDLGIGPNIAHSGGFREKSLDGGITVPDPHLFSSRSIVDFSATVGFGWRTRSICNNVAFEVDYRFFFLGEGKLKKNNSQLRNTLRTGNSYANALFVSIAI